MQQQTVLKGLLSPIVEALGLDWVGIQIFPAGKRSLVRLYVDKAGGVSLSDCAQVSRQVNALLSVEAVLSGEYTLEVSSPGLDRVLFTLEQCAEQIGKQVSIRLSASVEGKRNFKGTLCGVEEDVVRVELEDKQEMHFPFTEIEEARCVPEW